MAEEGGEDNWNTVTPRRQRPNTVSPTPDTIDRGTDTTNRFFSLQDNAIPGLLGFFNRAQEQEPEDNVETEPEDAEPTEEENVVTEEPQPQPQPRTP